MRVAVVGGSPIGRRVARDLAERPGIDQVVVAGIRAEGGAQGAPGQVRIDLEPSTRLADVLRDCDAALGCFDGDASNELAAVREAIAAGASYVSASSDPDVLEEILLLDGEARTARARIIAGLSISPGISSLLAGAVAARLSEVRSVRIAWTVQLAGPDSEPAWNAAARSLMGYAPAFEGGAWQREPAGGAEEDVFLPDPLGWQRVRRARGAEVLTLPKHLPTLEQVIVKGRLGEVLADRLVAAARRGDPSRGTIERAVGLGRMLAQRVPAPGKTHWSAVRVDVSGTGDDGAPADRSLAVLDQLANLASAPLVAGALLAASGEITATGCLPPEASVPPARFFTLLAELGVRVATLDRTGAAQPPR
jgi:saccharopine dehydrogenase-like NADP-dependent oxidoreductase